MLSLDGKESSAIRQKNSNSHCDPGFHENVLKTHVVPINGFHTNAHQGMLQKVSMPPHGERHSLPIESMEICSGLVGPLSSHTTPDPIAFCMETWNLMQASFSSLLYNFGIKQKVIVNPWDKEISNVLLWFCKALKEISKCMWRVPYLHEYPSTNRGGLLCLLTMSGWKLHLLIHVKSLSFLRSKCKKLPLLCFVVYICLGSW